MNLKNYKKIYQKFESQGFIKLKNFFSKSEIKKTKIELLKYLNDQTLKSKKSHIHFAKNSKSINSVHNLNWSKIKKFQKNKKINQIIKFLFKEKIKSFGAEVFAKPAKVGMAVPIHQDNYYWNLNNSKGVTVWIALDKSNQKNGAIFYFKNTHKLGLLEHKASYAPGSSQKLKNLKILKNFKKISPRLNEGDILIHHCLILHGSKKNLSNKSRTGLTLRFIANSSKILMSAKLKYEKSLKKQLLN